METMCKLLLLAIILSNNLYCKIGNLCIAHQQETLYKLLLLAIVPQQYSESMALQNCIVHQQETLCKLLLLAVVLSNNLAVWHLYTNRKHCVSVTIGGKKQTTYKKFRCGRGPAKIEIHIELCKRCPNWAV